MLALINRGKKATLGLAALTPIFDILQPASQFSWALLAISVVIFLLSFTSLEFLGKSLATLRDESLLVLLVSACYVVYNLQPDPPRRPLITAATDRLDEISASVARVEDTVERSAAQTDRIETNTSDMLDQQSAMLSNQAKFIVEKYYGSKEIPLLEHNKFRLEGKTYQQSLVSMADGERVISEPRFFSIAKQGDLDNNGYVDVAAVTYGGGTCCQPWLDSIFLNLGEQRFAEIEVPTHESWEFYELGTGQGLKLFGYNGDMTEYIITKDGLAEIANFRQAAYFYDFDEVYDLRPHNGDVPEFVEEVEVGDLEEPTQSTVGLERIFQGHLNNNDIVDEIQCYSSGVTISFGMYLPPCRIVIDGISTSQRTSKEGDQDFLFSVVGIDRTKSGRAKVYLGSQGASKSEFHPLPVSYD
ncbi:hypothetical protein LVO79_11060 [Roseivivax marinus]|uniref:hypothetical protein n=1 Tax=Roseivivax marinus TaxID=1379903 RepID=UPI001F03D2C2|nr:hypothetical protein [Roseivivax marinus]UMA63579.1 hypothetical protein LVO79_11060 [Roseivivax marinus]